MDRIWINGHFYTEDKAYPACSALYARNGVIMAMGTDEEVLSYDKEGKAQICDLKGAYVLPAFRESHMHLLEYAQQDTMVHLEDAKSFRDVMDLCSARLDWAKENGKWIAAVGFNQDDWDEAILPTGEDLDRISTEVPITIRRSCLHISVCNSKAMKVMGLNENTITAAPENYDRRPDGSLNGVIREMAQFEIFSSFPKLSKDEIKAQILHGCKKLAEYGITEVQTDDFHSVPGVDAETIIDAYRELGEAGALPIRVYEQCYLHDEKGLQQFLDAGHYTGQTFGNFMIGPLKVVMDGSLGSHSAFMRSDYRNDPGQRGIAYYTEEEVYRYMKLAHDNGMQIAIHCIGDAALDRILKALKRIQWENPRVDCRHGIVHCQIMDDEQLEVFRKQGLIGYVQPIFLRCDMYVVNECVGDSLASTSYNWRKFLDKGVHLSGGSDCPVEFFDIMKNLQYAVTRTDFKTGKAWYPENAVTREEAVSMFTYEGAYASFGERERGTLSIGKEADLVVLDRDFFSVPAEQIDKIRVLQTVCKGKVLYQK